MSENSPIRKEGRPQRSCDTCRIRKVRCDKASPCSACVASGFSCHTTPRTKLKRKRSKGDPSDQTGDEVSTTRSSPLVIADSVPAEDQRNSSAARTSLRTQPLPTVRSYQNPPHEFKNTHDKITYPFSESPAVLEDQDEFEGESSLHAHTVAARELFEKSLGNTLLASSNPDVVAAISSLRQFEDKKQSQERMHKKLLTSNLGDRHAPLYKLTLPPADAVIDALRQASESATVHFSSALGVASLSQVKTLCQAVFFNVDNYPTSTAVIVHGSLYNLFAEFAMMNAADEQARERYNHLASICRRNLEFSLLSLDLILPTTLESIQALALGVNFTIETSRPGLCKKLLSSACSLLQNLGWHRSDAVKYDDKETRHLKIKIFWLCYIIDKSLSLRLGQASVLQDYDIDLPLPSYEDEEFSGRLSSDMLCRWIKLARIQGRIYQELFSPLALKQTEASRMKTSHSLFSDCMEFKTTLEQMEAVRIRSGPVASMPAAFEAALSVIDYSDKIMLHSLLTMVYRATPQVPDQPIDPSFECLREARTALDLHQKCSDVYKDRFVDAWTMYLHWTILNAPFIPFTVVFCNALASCDRADLQRLENFAETLADCDYSEGAKNMHQLTSAFSKVAKLYVEAKAQERPRPQQQHHHQEPGMNSTPSWAPIDSYLSALGMPGDVFGGLKGNNNDLGNWFSGNQYMIGMLDQDLSYFDLFPESTVPQF